MRLKFGKYKGKHIADVPLGYLAWLFEECDVDGELRDAIGQEIVDRIDCNLDIPQPTTPRCGRCGRLTNALAEWYRRAARQYHPNVGGSNDAMKAVNDIHARLETILK